MTSEDAKTAYARRVDIVKERLRADVRGLLLALGFDHRFMSRARYSGLPPHRQSDNQSAFAVYLGGPKAGGWIDFVSGEKGDALNLIMLVKGCDFKTAVAWAEDRYGTRNMTEEQRLATQKQIEVRAKALDEMEAKRLAKRQRSANYMFGQALPVTRGDLVDKYLLSRGIDLRALPFERRWLRFLPATTYWMLPNKPMLPAMAAGMLDADGTQRAVHLTFLKPDGSGKADVPKPKLMWPEVKGLVIRLNRGAHEKGVLALCEGIEDGLSLAMARPDLRVWAASSLSNLLNVPDQDCATSYLVAQDNDWGKDQAQAQFARAVERLKSFGKPVAVIRSTRGKDFNDQLRESTC